jgi:hypothetical protein
MQEADEGIEGFVDRKLVTRSQEQNKNGHPPRMEGARLFQNCSGCLSSLKIDQTTTGRNRGTESLPEPLIGDEVIKIPRTLEIVAPTRAVA